MIATTNDLPGRRIVEAKGTAQGSIVRARHVGSDIVAGLKKSCGW